MEGIFMIILKLDVQVFEFYKFTDRHGDVGVIY